MDARRSGDRQHASMRPGREGAGMRRRGLRRHRLPACFNEARAQRPGNGAAGRSQGSRLGGCFNEARAQRPGNGSAALVIMRTGTRGFNEARAQRPGNGPSLHALPSTAEIAPAASGRTDRSQVRRGFGHSTGSRLQTTKRNQHVLPSRALPAISSAPQPSLRCGSLSPIPSDDHGAPFNRRECRA